MWPQRPAAGAPRETILVVEDELQLRLLTVESLRDLGYTVRHADGGAEALAILAAHPGIGLLFTDLMMAEMTGNELARQALQRWPDLGILYTSGYAKLDAADGVIEPAAEILAKPYAIQQLAQKVREHFDRNPTAAHAASQASGS